MSQLSVLCLQSGAFYPFGDLLRLRSPLGGADCSEAFGVFRLDLHGDCLQRSFAGLAPRSLAFAAPHASCKRSRFRWWKAPRHSSAQG